MINKRKGKGKREREKSNPGGKKAIRMSEYYNSIIYIYLFQVIILSPNTNKKEIRPWSVIRA